MMIRLPLAVLAICLGGATAQSATLRTMTTLRAPVVRLSDLFDDAGANADRVLGPGPGAGGRIVVEAAQLGAIARQFGVDWRPASSADRAVLDRPGRPLRREDGPGRREERPDRRRHIARLRHRTGRLYGTTWCRSSRIRGRWCPTLAYDSNAGRFTAMLSVAGEAMEPIYMRLAGRVDDTIELPVATTRLPAGSVLRADDVHVARVHTSTDPRRGGAPDR